MYQDVGLRNHQAVRTNGHKVVEKLKSRPETAHLAQTYQWQLDKLETLFKAANLLVNDG